MTEEKKQIERLLNRGVENLYPSKEAFEKRLTSGKKMRIYQGIDPTAPFLHIGHTIPLKKLREFQDLGHEVILLIGSFTAMLGDPTDKTAARTQLTRKEVLKNAETYKKQASKVLRFSGKNAAKIKFNHKWLSKMGFDEVVGLASHFTVQQMLERDMFERRIKDGKPVYMHEFMYPLMQGYDSVVMDVDAEIGGSDQTFNMLAGRTLMKSMKQKEKFVLTMKLLTNDEGKKMSKSEGGFIALNDSPEEMYGKIMAMNDSVMLSYFELVTDIPHAEIDDVKKQLHSGVNPRDIKKRLAHAVVEQFHSRQDADAAQSHFEAVFSKGEMPEDMQRHALQSSTNIIDVLVEIGLCSSKSEARRMVAQNAVKVDGEVVNDANTELVGSSDGIVLQRGKRHFVKLVK